MALVRGCKWAKETFEKGSRPTNETIVKWIEAEEIDGKVIDGTPYVDADRFAMSGPRPGMQQKQELTALDLIA